MFILQKVILRNDFRKMSPEPFCKMKIKMSEDMQEELEDREIEQIEIDTEKAA